MHVCIIIISLVKSIYIIILRITACMSTHNEDTQCMPLGSLISTFNDPYDKLDSLNQKWNVIEHKVWT